MMADRPEPIAFGPPARPLFGFVHHPPETARQSSHGVVICAPFGNEALCAHRTLRHFAESAALRGLPVLRFDYDGAGDSAGDDRDAGRWHAWTCSVRHAIDTLKRRTGVTHVHVLGLRLGAAIAASAAIDRSDIVGFIAIAPVTKGRAWLREANALEIAMRFPGPPSSVPARAGEHESVGFAITEETRGTILGVDLVQLNQPPAPRVLIIDRDDLPLDSRWADRLRGLGATVEHERHPGYAAMMLDPHEAVVPTSMVERVAAWLEQHSVLTPVAPATRPRPAVEAGPMPVTAEIEEIPGYLGDRSNLFGVVSLPKSGPRPQRAILLLNSGANPHSGSSRMYVDLARRWAARGYVVLRFDQAGIGDSAPFSGESENVVYSPSALRGIEAAVAHMRERWSVTEFHALGLCSGAYHAFKAAVAGLPLKSVVIINPLVFFWKPGMSLAYPPYQVSGAAAQYKKSFLQVEKWRKLLAGKVNVGAIVNVLARRTAQRGRRLAGDLARALHRPLEDDLSVELEAVTSRGVALTFVFASGDPGEDLLRFQAGAAVRRLEREQRLRLVRIDGPNHSFTPIWTRDVLTQVLDVALGVQ